MLSEFGEKPAAAKVANALEADSKKFIPENQSPTVQSRVKIIYQIRSCPAVSLILGLSLSLLSAETSAKNKWRPAIANCGIKATNMTNMPMGNMAPFQQASNYFYQGPLPQSNYNTMDGNMDIESRLAKIERQLNNDKYGFGKNGVLSFITTYKDSSKKIFYNDIALEKFIFNTSIIDENDNKFNVTCRF